MLLNIEELRLLVPGARLDHRGKNLRTMCPQCGQSEFGISLDENHRYGCFRAKNCGFSGNIFTLLAFLGKSVYDVRPGFSPRATIDMEKMLVHQTYKLDLNIEDCKPPLGFKRIDCHPYLEGRGFVQEDYEKYKVGVTSIDSRYKDFVIMLIEQFGNVKATIARSQKTKQEIETLNTYYELTGSKKRELRYINSYSDFSKILLGVEELKSETDTVILVEGLFDKHNTDSKLELAYQKEVKCCATFKCAISAEQMFLLQQSGVRRLIVMYDPDVIDSVKKAAWELDPYFDTYVGYNETGRDPGDMTTSDFDDVFAGLKSPSQFSKLNVPTLQKK